METTYLRTLNKVHITCRSLMHWDVHPTTFRAKLMIKRQSQRSHSTNSLILRYVFYPRCWEACLYQWIVTQTTLTIPWIGSKASQLQARSYRPTILCLTILHTQARMNTLFE